MWDLNWDSVGTFLEWPAMNFKHMMPCVVIRNFCSNFGMFSCETVVWLPSLSCAMAQKLTSKGLDTLSSCLLYTCVTAYYTMVAAVKENIICLVNAACPPTEQHRTGDRSFRPEAGPANLPASESREKQPSTVQVPRKPRSKNVWPWPLWYSISGCAEGIALHNIIIILYVFQ